MPGRAVRSHRRSPRSSPTRTGTPCSTSSSASVRPALYTPIVPAAHSHPASRLRQLHTSNVRPSPHCIAPNQPAHSLLPAQPERAREAPRHDAIRRLRSLRPAQRRRPLEQHALRGPQARGAPLLPSLPHSCHTDADLCVVPLDGDRHLVRDEPALQDGHVRGAHPRLLAIETSFVPTLTLIRPGHDWFRGRMMHQRPHSSPSPDAHTRRPASRLASICTSVHISLSPPPFGPPPHSARPYHTRAPSRNVFRLMPY